MPTIIHTDQAPVAIGAYNQAIQAGQMVFISGQIGLDPKTGSMRSAIFEEQAHQAFQNLRAVCQAASGDLHKLVKMTVFLSDMQYFQRFNEIMVDYFGDHPYPSRSVVACLGLPRNASIELEGIMFLD